LDIGYVGPYLIPPGLKNTASESSRDIQMDSIPRYLRNSSVVQHHRSFSKQVSRRLTHAEKGNDANVLLSNFFFGLIQSIILKNILSLDP